MNPVSANPVYRAPYPQQQTNGNIGNQQPPRAFTAPYTANIFGGSATFQPIPTLTFVPATSATIAARITPLPGGPSVGVSATSRFQPVITLSPNDAGGLKVSVAPKMQIELNGDLSVGIPNILGSGIGVRGGGSLSKSFTFNAPEFSVNVNPNGSFNLNANINPTLTTTQRIGVNGGVEGNVSSSGVGAGAGVNQSFEHQTEQEINVGGPGVQFAMAPRGRPTITTNFDNTVSISNSYSFVPRSSINANVQAGPFTANAEGGLTPGVTVKYKMTFSTDLSSKTPPKTEVSVTPGVIADASFGIGVSLFPSNWPVSLEASIAANPSVELSAGGSYTV